MLFLPDNAPIHTARMVQNWFGEQGMPLMDWPPDSPDFAPIEHGMIEICPPGWAAVQIESNYSVAGDWSPQDGTLPSIGRE